MIRVPGRSAPDATDWAVTTRPARGESDSAPAARIEKIGGARLN